MDFCVICDFSSMLPEELSDKSPMRADLTGAASFMGEKAADEA